MHNEHGMCEGVVFVARFQVGHGAGVASSGGVGLGGTLLVSCAQSGQRTGWCGLELC